MTEHQLFEGLKPISEKIAQLKQEIINQSVENLKEFGYPSVNNENIFTDKLYKSFFMKMLNHSYGINDVLDFIIKSIYKDLDKL